MRRMALGTLLLVVVLGASAGTSAEAKTKVGVFESVGHRVSGCKGILEALRGCDDMEAVGLDGGAVSLTDLMEYDVLVLGSAASPGDTIEETIRTFVKCGGGLLLHHWSCGGNDFRGWAKPWFSNIVSVTGRTRQTALLPLKVSHPILAGLPATFQHAYGDHAVLAGGPEGKVLVKGGDGVPALIIGKEGSGRIVANAACTGLLPADGEGAPQGGELTLLLNSIRWLGEKPLTSLDPEELAARRREAEYPLLLEQVSKYKQDTVSWFSEDLLRCTYLERPPVESLGGRFFLIARWRPLNSAGYERARHNLRQLRLMGVTDILQLTIRNSAVVHPTSNPEALPYGNSWKTMDDYDPLMTLVEAAGKEGIGVWIKLQIAYGELKEDMRARDGKGNPYFRGSVCKPHKNLIPDVLGPAYPEVSSWDDR